LFSCLAVYPSACLVAYLIACLPARLPTGLPVWLSPRERTRVFVFDESEWVGVVSSHDDEDSGASDASSHASDDEDASHRNRDKDGDTDKQSSPSTSNQPQPQPHQHQQSEGTIDAEFDEEDYLDRLQVNLFKPRGVRWRCKLRRDHPTDKIPTHPSCLQ